MKPGTHTDVSETTPPGGQVPAPSQTANPVGERQPARTPGFWAKLAVTLWLLAVLGVAWLQTNPKRKGTAGKWMRSASQSIHEFFSARTLYEEKQMEKEKEIEKEQEREKDK